MLSFQEDPGDDFTIIPVEMFADFIMTFRVGYGDPMVGPTQEVKFEVDDLDSTVHACQYVSNPDATLVKEDSDSDSEGEESSQPVKKKMKISNLAKLMCSMTTRANKMVQAQRAPLVASIQKKLEYFPPVY